MPNNTVNRYKVNVTTFGEYHQFIKYSPTLAGAYFKLNELLTTLYNWEKREKVNFIGVSVFIFDQESESKLFHSFGTFKSILYELRDY